MSETIKVGPKELKAMAMEGLEATVFALREPCTLDNARNARQVAVSALHQIKVRRVQDARQPTERWLTMMCTRHGRAELHICLDHEFQRMRLAYEESEQKNKVVLLPATQAQMNEFASGAMAVGVWVCWCGQ